MRRANHRAQDESLAPVSLIVDGNRSQVQPLDAGEPLLSALRRSGHTAPKLACGRGECGACTVLIDGRPVLSCTALLATSTGAEVTTAAGLDAADLREAFADHVAFQCGFCTPGQIVRAEALLRDDDCRSRAEVTRAIAGNVCRCTGYVQIVDAIMDVADRRRQAATR